MNYLYLASHYDGDVGRAANAVRLCTSANVHFKKNDFPWRIVTTLAYALNKDRQDPFHPVLSDPNSYEGPEWRMPPKPEAPERCHLAWCIDVLSQCDGLYLHESAKDSRGAQIEKAFANRCEIPVWDAMDGGNGLEGKDLADWLIECLPTGDKK